MGGGGGRVVLVKDAYYASSHAKYAIEALSAIAGSRRPNTRRASDGKRVRSTDVERDRKKKHLVKPYAKCNGKHIARVLGRPVVLAPM
jgi:hypothetical protein